MNLNTIHDPTVPPGKATRINLFQFNTPQMRAFHMSWFAFFLCFLAWFGLAPFMPQIRTEMKLSPDQVKWAGIAAVGITFFARLGFGRLCDAIGPRLTYTILLVVGSVPVMAVGLAHSYPAFLVARLLIGVIGASFVITQYHTSMMFAPNVVGTANAMTGGWGNMGGGFTQQIMPVVAGWIVAAGVSKAGSWRLCMLGAGAVCLLTGVAYFFMTQDTPQGNLIPLRKARHRPAGQAQELLGRRGRLPHLVPVPDLRRVLRHRADDRQQRPPVLPRLLPHGPEVGRVDRPELRRAEPVRPRDRRVRLATG